MRTLMIRSTLAATILALGVFASPSEARCFQDGQTMQCIEYRSPLGGSGGGGGSSESCTTTTTWTHRSDGSVEVTVNSNC